MCKIITVVVVPLKLNDVYELALLSIHSYSSLPNIEKGSQVYPRKRASPKSTTIQSPERSYEIGDTEAFIQQQHRSQM